MHTHITRELAVLGFVAIAFAWSHALFDVGEAQSTAASVEIALAANAEGGTVCFPDYSALVRAPELTLITTIPVGDSPGWAETADNGICLIGDARSDDLSIISLPQQKELRRLPTGDGPKHTTVTRLPAAVIAAVKARL